VLTTSTRRPIGIIPGPAGPFAPGSRPRCRRSNRHDVKVYRTGHRLGPVQNHIVPAEVGLNRAGSDTRDARNQFPRPSPEKSRTHVAACRWGRAGE